MHIHLFISDHATEGHRLQALIVDKMPEVPVIQYHGIEAVGRVVPAAYDEKVVALVMVAKIEELVILARGQNLWMRSKTVLILPSNEPELVSRGHALRPVYTAFSNGDFSDVLSVISHIRSRSKRKPRPGIFRPDKGGKR